MGLELKPLTIDNYDAIISLWAEAGLPFKPFGRDSREFMSKEMALSHTAFFGIFDDRKLIAVGIANYDGRRGWVNRVAVDPDQRGQGLAGRIIAECEAFLRAQGAVVICALIETVNSPSISCFQKDGYQYEKEIGYFTKRDSAEA
ncbi:MAG: GNAT family N-acetyltransferase [bacterium]|nr:GNAT family N-acetyltransferase [bacterium]